ncbi:hypothetical protein FRB94_008857 [Tulasnella sp. JGI-2019a]|nr:hypothetical protein FRB93_002798 [Tulasnella sp. JGI-2019a]KAG8995703.1 hypothetical protein FRB94_008857 [Tulasnella sp. JGI-2019a]
MPCPSSLPNPISAHLASLQLAPPSQPHPSIFFDPPSTNSTTHAQTVLTPICEKAIDFVHALLPSWGKNHVYRTYAVGLAVADHAGWTIAPKSEELGWDREAWFLAAILHDIGWDQQENLKSRLSFEIYGGVKAREILMGWGASQDIADEVCESTVRHTDFGATTGSIRLMTALVQIGAGHDLLGFAVPHFLHPEDSRMINERWPRLGIAQQLTHDLQDELKHKPGCIASKWEADVIRGNMIGIECYKGLEGEPTDDPEWKERRKTVAVDTYGYRQISKT